MEEEKEREEAEEDAVGGRGEREEAIEVIRDSTGRTVREVRLELGIGSSGGVVHSKRILVRSEGRRGGRGLVGAYTKSGGV